MQVNKPAVAILFAIFGSQFILLLLKTLNVVDWDWGWILAPLWIPYVLILLCGFIIVIYFIAVNIKERMLCNGRK